MDYKEFAEHPDFSSREKVGEWVETAATVIVKLLSRAEAAEAARDEARQDCSVAERNHMIEVERRKEAESRAEKAEMEREKAVELIGWIYYKACTSVEHDMRPHLDWLKDKIEEWRKNKEE